MQKTSIIAVVKKKKTVHTFGTIYIRGYYNNKPVSAISTGYKIELDNWDSESHQALAKAPNANLINASISKKLQEMQATLLKIELMGSNLNRRHVKAAVRGEDLSRDFFTFCSEMIALNYTNRETIRTYTSEITKMRRFKQHVSFADIDFSFLQEYKRHMRDQLKNSDNTIWKTFKFLKKMVTDAKKKGGIIKQDPFEEFDRGTYSQTDRTFLSIEECNQIFQTAKDETLPVMVRTVASYFLLMCYSGLRYEDAITFKPAIHIIENERLVRKTSKGKGNIINIILYGRLREIVEMVKLFPLKMSNKKFNEWLQIVAAHSRINKHITCHVGRHTFGSFLPDAGISKEAAQKLLGHSDMRSTNIYYHMKDKNVDDAAEKLNAL